MLGGWIAAAVLTGCAGGPSTGSPAPEPGEPAGELAAESQARAGVGDAPAAEPEAELSHEAEPSDQPAENPLEPPDGQWLRDEEGREYFISKLEKREGTYRWIDDTHIRVAYGMQLEVVDHDDEYFYFKVYRSVQGERARQPAVSPEELSRVAATYEADVGTVDRLRFEPFEEGLPRTGQWRNGFDVADMNGDGHLDIVHGPPRKGRPVPVIFLGDGKGGWRFWSEASFPAFAFDYGDAAVGDFNGDGIPDLALAMHLKGAMALIGDGEGGFTRWSEGIEVDEPGGRTRGTSFSSRAVTVADWNRDGRPDILLLGEGPKGLEMIRRGGGGLTAASYGVRVYLNNGDGSWRAEPGSEEGSRLFGDSLALGDFDADGRLDLATGSSRAGHAQIVQLGLGGAERVVPALPLRPEALIDAVAAVDFDGDGRDDVALGYATNELGVWRTGVDLFFPREDGRWERRVLAAVEDRTRIWGLDVGDLDGDGAADLVAATGGGELWVFLGDGRGSLSREGSPELPQPVEGCRGYEVRLADLDRDGSDELVVGFAGESSGLVGVMSSPGCTGGGSLRAWKAVAVR